MKTRSCTNATKRNAPPAISTPTDVVLNRARLRNHATKHIIEAIIRAKNRKITPPPEASR